MIRSALMAKEIQIIQLSISAYMVFGIAGAVCVDAGNVSVRFVLLCVTLCLVFIAYRLVLWLVCWRVGVLQT